jgi:cell division protein FtsI (penicillin-binding protein 3)
MSNIQKQMLLRLRIYFLIVILLGAGIAFKIVKIQFFDGKIWKNLVKAQKFEYRPIKAKRGSIYAFDGNLLSTSLPYYVAALDPCLVSEEYFYKNIDEFASLLADFYMDKSAEFYKNYIVKARKNGTRYLLLNKKAFTYKELAHMSNWPFFNKGRMGGGVIFNKKEKRYKPFGELASRTIGYVNGDGIGVGLEYSFNNVLSGINGSALYQKIVGNQYKIVHDGSELRPIDGYDLYTTLDINLQDVAHSKLYEVLTENEADYGSVVLMKVDTGEIRAMVNLAKTADGKYQEIYNYAIGNHGCREPGSSIKLASILAVLEEKDFAIENDIIDTGDGTYIMHDRKVKDLKRGGWGELSIQRVIETSSNIGIVKLVQDVFGNNPQKFINYLKKIGLNKPLDFQISGEAKTLIKDVNDPSWSGVSLAWMAFGYELKLTPLHILTLYNAVANKGKIVKPMIVSSVKQGTKIVKKFKPKTLEGTICSVSTLKKLRNMLEGVVQRGTARNIKEGYYQIAGKSGSAMRHVNGKYKNEWYTSFVGYFPADNPKYSCIVVIDNPKKFKQQGGDLCAPVFRRLADSISAKDIDMQEIISHKLTSKLNIIPKSVGNIDDILHFCNIVGVKYDKTLKQGWGTMYVSDNILNFEESYCYPKEQVPSVLGMTLKDALFLLESRGLNVIIEGQGRVVQQSLKPGCSIKEASNIIIKLKKCTK